MQADGFEILYLRIKHLLIMSGCKSDEEREFYIRLGLLLCATKNDEVVEYAMSRTMSPMLVSEYKLQLPDKKVLQKKLQELVNIPMIEE